MVGHVNGVKVAQAFLAIQFEPAAHTHPGFWVGQVVTLPERAPQVVNLLQAVPVQ